MSENKRRISKCEVCPYYAKNHEKGKWECTRKVSIWDDDEQERTEKNECVFTHHNYYRVEDDFTTQNQIIDRWIKANE
jgi:hypothetical protein